MKAVILAGGLGTRLRPYTLFVPKPLLPLGDRPLLEHILLSLKKYGFSEVVITVSYLSKLIENYFGSGEDLGVSIEYVRSNKPMGTGGQLRTTEARLDGTFLLLYGDQFIDTDLSKFVDYHRSKAGTATMLLMPYRQTLKYGFIDSDENGRLTNWREKPAVEGWINAGCYVMEKKFLEYIPPNTMYGMDEAFREALRRGEPIYTFKAEGDFIDIGDKEGYLSAHERYLQKIGRIK